MLEKALKQENRNKIVPGWLRALYAIPCLVAAVWIMIYLGNVYMYIAEIEASMLDGKYYVVLTGLLTAVVYLLILLVCLIPAWILVTITRMILERRQPKAPVSGEYNETVVSDRNRYS